MHDANELRIWLEKVRRFPPHLTAFESRAGRGGSQNLLVQRQQWQSWAAADRRIEPLTGSRKAKIIVPLSPALHVLRDN